VEPNVGQLRLYGLEILAKPPRWRRRGRRTTCRGRNDLASRPFAADRREGIEAAMMEDEPAAVARASYDAYVDKDRASIEALIADDFHFTSPLDNRIDRAAYFARCWPNSAMIAGFAFLHLVPAGERVFVTYEGQGAGGKRFRNTEILTIRDGQICDVEVDFGWSIPHEAAPGGFVEAAAHG
jgi:hypothetical protein